MWKQKIAGEVGNCGCGKGSNSSREEFIKREECRAWSKCGMSYLLCIFQKLHVLELRYFPYSVFVASVNSE